MTFWMQPSFAPQEPRIAPETEGGFAETVGAGWTAEAIEADVNFRFARERQAVLAEMEDRLPPAPEPDPTTQRRDARRGSSPQRRERDTFARASQFVAEDPAAWGNLPLTADQLDEEVNRRLLVELEEAQEVLGLGGIIPEFLGRGGRAATDNANLLTMPIGGPGKTIVGTLGRGAVGGVAGEAITLPRQYEAADRLGLPDPNLLVQLGTAAIFGAAFEGLAQGAQRGWAYYRQRQVRREDAPEGMDAVEAEAAVRETEADLLTGGPARQTAPDPGRAMQESMGLIREREGFRETAYWDVNAWRTGFGSDTITHADGRIEKVTRHSRVTRKDALRDLERRTVEFQDTVIREIGADRWASLNPNQKAVLTSLAYNYGSLEATGALRAFRSGDAQEVANAILGLRRHNQGVNAARRTHEAQIYAGMQGIDAPAIDLRTRTGFTRSDQVTTPTGRRVDVEYEVVDASILRRATGELQPRDRSRATSDEQIVEIAARLDPPRLMPAPEADRGAPVVGPDNVIESGNGRVMALQRAAQLHPDRFAAYRALIEQAGFEIPEGVSEPVLIARRTSDLSDSDRVRFAIEANSSDKARMAATQTAQIDARGLTPDVLQSLRLDQVPGARGNRSFVRQFLQSIPKNERDALIGSRGQLNLDGQRRLEQALFARAYGDADLLEVMAEAGTRDMRSLIDALIDAAPAWAQLRAAVEAGDVSPDLDGGPFLAQAIRAVARARSETGGTARARIDAALNAEDLFEGTPDPAVAAFVDILYAGPRARNQADVSALLRDYAIEAMRIGDGSGGLLGDAHSVGAREIINAALREDSIFAGDAPRARPRDGRTRPTDSGPEAGDIGGDADQLGFNIRDFDGTAFQDGAQGKAVEAIDDQLDANVREAISPERPSAPDGPDAPDDPDAFDARDLESARDDIEADGDFEITDAAGNTFKASDLLRQVDDDQNLADVLASCNPGRAA